MSYRRCIRGHVIWGDNALDRTNGSIGCRVCTLASDRRRAAKTAGRQISMDEAITAVLVTYAHLEYVIDGTMKSLSLPRRCKRGHWVTGYNAHVAASGARSCHLCMKVPWVRRGRPGMDTWAKCAAIVEEEFPDLWRDARTHPFTGELTEEFPGIGKLKWEKA